MNAVNCRLQALGLYNFVKAFRLAYKRRGLYPRGLITGIKKKKQFRNESPSIEGDSARRVLVIKMNSKQGKLEGGLYPGEGLIAGCKFWFTGRRACEGRGKLTRGGLTSGILRYTLIFCSVDNKLHKLKILFLHSSIPYLYLGAVLLSHGTLLSS